MSNWTHVAAVARIDGIACIADNIPDFDKVFGKECLFESPEEVWKEAENNPEDFLPMGSEGTLQKTVWQNPDKQCVAAYTVTIFGDLRDHDSEVAIIGWFQKALKKLPAGWFVRQAVVTAENERSGTSTWRWTDPLDNASVPDKQ